MFWWIMKKSYVFKCETQDNDEKNLNWIKPTSIGKLLLLHKVINLVFQYKFQIFYAKVLN